MQLQTLQLECHCSIVVLGPSGSYPKRADYYCVNDTAVWSDELGGQSIGIVSSVIIEKAWNFTVRLSYRLSRDSNSNSKDFVVDHSFYERKAVGGRAILWNGLKIPGGKKGNRVIYSIHACPLLIVWDLEWGVFGTATTGAQQQCRLANRSHIKSFSTTPDQ